MSDTNIHCAIKKDESRTQSRNAIGEVPLLSMRCTFFHIFILYKIWHASAGFWQLRTRGPSPVYGMRHKYSKFKGSQKRESISRAGTCSIPLMFAHQLNILCKCNHKLCCFCEQVTFPGILLRISWPKSRSLRSYPR